MQFFLDILNQYWPQAVTALLGIGVVGVWVAKISNVLKEAIEVIQAIISAAEDKAITKEEIDVIVKEAKDVWNAIKK